MLRPSFDPVSEFALGYVETLGHYMRESRPDRNGEVPVPAAFAIGRVTGTDTYATGIPRALQDHVMLPIGAALAKLRGYELHLPG